MKELEQYILQYLQERGWDNLKPADIAKSIMIEGAELLEVFQWSDQSLDEVRNDSAKMAKIKEELADVFVFAIEMAVLLGIDSKQIILDKNNKSRQKYPADLIKGNKDKGSGELYLKIKQEHRQGKAKDIDA